MTTEQFHRLADEGKEINKAKEHSESDRMISHLKAMTERAKRKRGIEWQRDELIRHIARALGIDDDMFRDFLDYI